MKILNLLLIAVLCYACGNTAGPATPPEPIEDWQPLFNGKDLTGWDVKFSGKALNENFRGTFEWEDDMLRIKYDAYETFDDAYGHLYYSTPYSHYKLRFDYRFTGEQTPGGASWNVRNSGVMLHSQSAASNSYDQDFPVSLELQLLGGLSDGNPRTTGNLCTPGTAVMMGDTMEYRHCITSSSKTYDGDGWVHAEAVVMGGQGMHFLIEGDTVLTFQRPQIAGKNDAAHMTQWGMTEDTAAYIERDREPITSGYIALQAESHPIDFRNVEILMLDE